MFSVYLSMDQGNTTHLKIGGYDEEGVEGGLDSLQFLSTASSGSWAIQMKTVKIDEDIVEIKID
jgi:hypothetical protein